MVKSNEVVEFLTVSFIVSHLAAPAPLGAASLETMTVGNKVGMILGTRLEFFSVKVSRITITGKEIMTWKMHFIGGFTLGLIW